MCALAAVILRSLMIVVLTKAFHLEYLQGEAVQRSVTEMLGWMFRPGAFSELAMILKRTLVLYGVFCLCSTADPHFCPGGSRYYGGGDDPSDPRQRPVGTCSSAGSVSGSVFFIIY